MPSQPNLKTNGWLSGIPWAHRIGKGAGNAGLSGAASWREGNQEALTIQIRYGDLEAALLQILGTNLRDSVNAAQLNRTVPIQHPTRPHLHAARIASITPMNWQGKGSTAPGVNPSGNWSKYDYAELGIVFQQPKVNALLDDVDLDLYFPPIGGIRQEYRRMLEWKGSGASQTLSRPGGVAGNWIYAEGGAGGPTAGTTPVPGSLSQRFCQPVRTALWRNVPKRGLFSSAGNGNPSNIDNATGCVNSALWLGYPAGTLLLDSYSYEPVEVPTPFSVYDGTLPLGENALAYDVTLNFVYFNPANGGATTGWNLQPFPGTSAAIGKWWLVTQSGGAATANGDNCLLRRIDFNTIFQMLA